MGTRLMSSDSVTGKEESVFYGRSEEFVSFSAMRQYMKRMGCFSLAAVLVSEFSALLINL